jgi:transcriptional regulator
MIYRVEDSGWQRRIVDEHPLATLVSNGESVPYATHLPSLVRPGTPEEMPLAGAELVGHMNRANPHWASLAAGMRVRMIFGGPGGYVTPAVYQTDPAAPTWDFISIHVHGRLCLVDDREETLQIVRWTADTLEQRFGDKWDSTSSVSYFRQILPGVGAFRVRIESVDAMFKLSQEKPTEIQESVIQRFEQNDRGTDRQLARIMREIGLGNSIGK